jgi:4-amino-4-deoxy-L-arabinose transferase-like glycosyltransferase
MNPQNPQPNPDQEAKWDRLFWLMLVCVVVARALYALAFCAEFDLAGDEAYYWDWGRRPDWGYYSKPPMIGWLMGLVGFVSGNAEWGIRLAPLVLGTVSLIFTQRLTRMMFGSKTAFIVAALMLCTPGNAGLNLLFTIDSPLVLAWSAALWIFWRCIEKPDSWGRWMLLGFVLGFGSLSKQMMLIFPLLMVIYIVVSPADRRAIGNPRMWLSILMGFAALIPVLVWQRQHGWITLTHMKEHFDRAEPTWVNHLGWFFQFPLTQAALYSPITWGALLTVLVMAARSWKRGDRRTWFLFVFSGPALLAFHLLAARQDVHANWPAVFYVSAFILLAAWMEGAVMGSFGDNRIRAWSRRNSIRVGLVFALLMYVLPMIVRPAGFAGDSRVDGYFGALRSAREAGELAGEFLSKVPNPERTFVVVMGHRYHAARMAFYMPQQPRVFRWQKDGLVESQYEVWPGPIDKRGWDALIVYPNSDDGVKRELISTLRYAFRSTTKMGDIDVPIGNGIGRSYQVFLGSDLITWPNSNEAKALGEAF